MTQTKHFVITLTGLNLVIDPKATINPKGMASTKVKINSKQVE